MLHRSCTRTFLLNLIRNVSVEPVYFLFAISFNLCEFIHTNVYLQKACRPNSTTEPDLRTPCDDLEEGVKFITIINSNFNFIKMFCVLLIIIFLTAWSDGCGKKRKIFILLPIIGLLLQTSTGCLYVYVWTLPPILNAITDFVTEITFGSYLTLWIFSQIYISEVVATEDRTMRLGFLSALKLLSFVPSSGLAGYILHYFGFFWSYFICFNMALLALILGCILIQDTPIAVEEKISPCHVFIWRQVAESLKTIFGQGEGQQKIIVALLFTIHSMLLYTTAGQNTVIYLYLRYRFNWDEKMYSLFRVCGSIGTIIGVLFSSILLSKLLKIHDGLIAILATCWDSIITLMFCFANQNWHLFVANGANIFCSVGVTVTVSYASKFYKSSELGHLFSVLMMFNLIIPTCHPIYNVLFQQTMNTFPSAFFVLSLIFTAASFLTSCLTYYLHKRSLRA